ncbi:uncharacterized protein [Rutidosis leptorrhynchoides]|uniref:uncharacterized protein n=1 Tax=Rutidosis leptorrhynchoides TaxID=125765 RepID=UPI003A995A74
MAVSTKCSIKGQVKSISLPSRSHPTTLRIEQQLNTTKTAASVAAAKPTAETICNGLLELVEVYKCMDTLLNSSSTKLLISRQQNKKWVENLIDETVNFLDVCGSTKDMVTQIKEHIVDLQCALRRRKGDSNVENSIMKYNCFRKKIKKDIKLLAGNLKKVDNVITVVDSDIDHQLAAVIKSVIEVSEITVSVFESLLMFMSLPISRANKWALVVSKLMHKGMVTCEHQQEQMNEFESVEDALKSLYKCESYADEFEKMQVTKSRLEKLETRIDCVETKLECMFRQLIGTRSSLLNIISQ